jgi:hypothetical protein
MVAAVLAQVVDNGGRPGHGLPAAGHLAVQHPQGIAVFPAQAVAAQGGAASQQGRQGLPEPGPADRAAQGVDMGRGVGHVEAVDQGAQQKNQLHIRVWRGHTEDFGIDLVELAVAAFLGPLPAEHGADGVEFPDRVLGVHLVLDIGADIWMRWPRAAGSADRPCGRRRCTSPFRRCRCLRRCSGRKARSLHDGNADFAVAEILEQFDGGAFDMLPQFRFTGQDVLEPSDQLNAWLTHG